MLELTAITPVYAAIFGLLHVLLSWKVVTLRHKYKARMTEEGHTELTAVTRAQDDLREHLAIALLLLLLLEWQGFSPYMLHAQGLLLLVGRALHLKGMRDPSGSILRKSGTRLTWLQIIISSLLCLAGTFGLVLF